MNKIADCFFKMDKVPENQHFFITRIKFYTAKRENFVGISFMVSLKFH